MLCSRVAWRWLSIGGSGSEVDICKIKFYICRVIRNPQLGLESIRIAGAPRIWRLDPLQEWNEKDWNMGYEHLVWDNELRRFRGKT